MRNKLPTVSIPSRGIHVRKMRWTIAPCLVPTSGYPGERKALEPFCLSQWPKHAAVSVTAGSRAGAIPNHRNMCGRNRAASHGLPRMSLAGNGRQPRKMTKCSDFLCCIGKVFCRLGLNTHRGHSMEAKTLCRAPVVEASAVNVNVLYVGPSSRRNLN